MSSCTLSVDVDAVFASASGSGDGEATRRRIRLPRPPGMKRMSGALGVGDCVGFESREVGGERMLWSQGLIECCVNVLGAESTRQVVSITCSLGYNGFRRHGVERGCYECEA